MEHRNPPTGSDPIDERSPRAARTPFEVLAEAALMVPHAAVMMVRLMTDARVPFRSRALVVAVGCYIVSPIDVLPGRLRAIGHLDDVLVGSIAVDVLLSSVEDEVVESAWSGSEDGLDLVRSFVTWNADLVRSVVGLGRAR
jgi:uncharacterized membrane protein YkvA (DUF1232 family)